MSLAKRTKAIAILLIIHITLLCLLLVRNAVASAKKALAHPVPWHLPWAEAYSGSDGILGRLESLYGGRCLYAGLPPPAHSHPGGTKPELASTSTSSILTALS